MTRIILLLTFLLLPELGSSDLWTKIKTTCEIEQFAGKIIAYTSTLPSLIPQNPFHLDNDNQIIFALVSEHTDLEAEIPYRLHCCLKIDDLEQGKHLSDYALPTALSEEVIGLGVLHIRPITQEEKNLLKDFIANQRGTFSPGTFETWKILEKLA